MARPGMQTLVRQFVKAGGGYRVGIMRLENGSTLTATNYVFACGPWLRKVIPRLLGPRVFVTRQEVFFFGTPTGDARFATASFPDWASFHKGDIFYGMSDIVSRGFKVAHDTRGMPTDPDRGDRQASPGAPTDARAYFARRFLARANAPLNEERVCQYENSSNEILLVDRHPTAPNVLRGADPGVLDQKHNRHQPQTVPSRPFA